MTSALSLSKANLRTSIGSARLLAPLAAFRATAARETQGPQLRELRLGFFEVWRPDFEIRESSSAERVGQPFGIANNDKGQLIRMND